MYRLFQPICAGAPRLVGAAGGNYICPPGPSFTTQQWMLPSRDVPVPHENDPRFHRRIYPIVRKLNIPRLKAKRARPRASRVDLATTKPLKIAYKLGQPGIPRGTEQTGVVDVLGYSPRYLLRAGYGISPRKLPGAQTYMPPLKAGNKAIARVEHISMPKLKLPPE